MTFAGVNAAAGGWGVVCSGQGGDHFLLAILRFLVASMS